ncbi:MAG: outer membrane protein OmpA-like peptidoglycan-associated protein [Gammaproteobacteria bacterium]|jgi:outer membrane protein OmpA-like peptidoglycan-associated protein
MKKLCFLLCYLCGTVLYGQGFPVMDNTELGALQSIHDESQPVMAADGKTLYFSRKGHPQNIGDDDQYDIWIAFRKNEEDWGKPIHMSLPINNRADNFVVSTSSDGQSLFLWDGSQEAGTELVYTKKRGRSWTNPKPVEIQNFTSESPVSYAMADDNQILLLATDHANGNGGRDIYVAKKKETGIWSEPFNLGTTINSSSEEIHAQLAADNKTLYFLSNGFEDPVSMTLMVSYRTGESWKDWSTPKSTGISLDQDLFRPYFSIAADGKTMYASGKETAEGEEQLFSFLLPDQYQPEPVSLVGGKLIDAETGMELDGEVMLEALGSSGESLQQETNRGGRFQFVLPNDEHFNLSAEVPGYFAKSETIANESLQELDKEEGTRNTNREVVMSPEVDQLNVRLQQLNKAMQDLGQRRAATQQEMGHRKRLNWSPTKESTQLEALQRKYEKALGLTSPFVEAVSTGDSELDAMKRRFNKHNGAEGSNTTVTKKSAAPKGESQLEAMKRKYREANALSEDNEGTEDVVEEEIVETNEVKEAVVMSTTSVDYSFSEMVAQSHSDLEEELSERVIKELRADLLPEVSFKMNAAMDANYREQYANRLQRKTAALESEAKRELRKKYKSEVKRELRGELLEEVEKELRELLRDEVKRELRKELEDEVRQELRLELEYILTQEIARDVQKQLSVLIKELKKNTIATPGNYYGGAVASNAQRKSIDKAQRDISLELYPLKNGRIIPLNNIFFKANSDQWKESALPELNRIYNLLNQNIGLKIEIGGHCNGWCSTGFANNLSANRAKAVADFLIEKGISSDRLSSKGYGKTQPLVPNDSVENCKKNQRMEMKVLQEE